MSNIPGWNAACILYDNNYPSCHYAQAIRVNNNNNYNKPKLFPQSDPCDYVCKPCWKCIDKHGSENPSCYNVCQDCWTCDPIFSDPLLANVSEWRPTQPVRQIDDSTYYYGYAGK